MSVVQPATIFAASERRFCLGMKSTSRKTKKDGGGRRERHFDTHTQTQADRETSCPLMMLETLDLAMP